MRTVLWWHLHQPDYREPGTDAAGLPWVRMHALRAYTDLPALILDEGLAGMTINLVPSLCDQLEDLARGAREDRYHRLARAVAAGDEAAADDAFRVHTAPTPVPSRPLPRLEELRAQAAHDGRRPSLAEAVDACVLFHLSWVGFTACEQPLVQHLFGKGRDFDAEELEALLALTRRFCAEVLPRLSRAQQEGLVHLTPTPYFHPILPLVIDSASAHEATSDRGAPPPFAYPGDARAQVEMALARHEALFGERPKAMWPAEGSLSEAALDVFAAAGVEVVASDQALLHKSGVHGHGGLDPHLFPWRHERTGVHVLFRDRRLSDDWGFVYRDLSPAEAMEGFVGGLKARARAGAAVTSVILDGENPFERFRDAGRAHLRELARRAGELRFASPEEAAHEGPRPLPHLATGSWIDASFDIWAGDREDREAWRLLADVRRIVEEAELEGEQREAALWHLYAAEGSDWFWWFGPEFHAEEQPTFDRLFRAHLVSALRAAGKDPALVPALALPVHQGASEVPVRTALPLGEPEDEPSPHALWPWANGVTVKAESGQGTMHRGAPVLPEVRAVAGHEELHVMALCRDDVFELTLRVVGPRGERVHRFPASRRGGVMLAQARLEWTGLDVGSGEALRLAATARAPGAEATLPEGEDGFVLVRPAEGSFEA